MTSKYSSPPDKFSFYRQVWNIVHKIPPGNVATYGQIAGMLLPPDGIELRTYKSFGARWVGSAMAACPEDVPWQRVVNSQGKISPRQGGSHIRQKDLLESEGVVFDEQQKIDLSKYLWTGS